MDKSKTERILTVFLSLAFATFGSSCAHELPPLDSCHDAATCTEIAAHAPPKQLAQAMPFIEKSCVLKGAEACEFMFKIYWNGTKDHEVPADKERALGYLDKACEIGSKSACHNLAVFEPDEAKSRGALKKACSLGMPGDCALLNSLGPIH